MFPVQRVPTTGLYFPPLNRVGSPLFRGGSLCFLPPKHLNRGGSPLFRGGSLCFLPPKHLNRGGSPLFRGSSLCFLPPKHLNRGGSAVLGGRGSRRRAARRRRGCLGVAAPWSQSGNGRSRETFCLSPDGPICSEMLRSVGISPYMLVLGGAWPAWPVLSVKLGDESLAFRSVG